MNWVKKLKISIAITIIISLMPIPTMRINASIEEADGWLYEVLDDGTISIESYRGDENNIVIPNEIEGHIVSTLRTAFLCDSGSQCIYLYIPDTIKVIEQDAFEGASLKWIEVAENNNYYCSNEGSLYNKEKTKFINYANQKEDRIFIMPESVVEIAPSAFEASRYLEEIKVSDNVKKIGEWAFQYCTSLRTITLPNKIKKIEQGMLMECYSLGSIKIPDSVESIADHAFRDCTNLSEITIPNSITYIGSYVFEDTLWLKNNSNLNAQVIVNNILVDGHKCSGRVILKDNIKLISPDAFYYNEDITDVEIGKGVVEIGESSFEYCENLRSVNLGSQIEIVGDKAFQGCSQLENISFPTSIHKIGYNAFGSTIWLERMRNANNYMVVANSILVDGRNCEGHVVIPDNIVSISPGAFEFSDINKCTLSESVIEIGALTFYSCKNLESIILPVSVKKVDAFAFAYSNISYMVVKNPECYLEDYLFGDYFVTDYTAQNRHIVLYGYKGSTAESYAKKYDWIEYCDIKEFEDKDIKKEEINTKVNVQMTSNNSNVVKTPNGTKVKKLKKAKKSLKVTWTKVKTVTGYQIQYSISSKFKNAKKITIEKATTTSKTIKKLKAKKKYYVRIRTYIMVNGKKKYSNWSKKKSQKTK